MPHDRPVHMHRSDAGAAEFLSGPGHHLRAARDRHAERASADDEQSDIHYPFSLYVMLPASTITVVSPAARHRRTR